MISDSLLRIPGQRVTDGLVDVDVFANTSASTTGRKVCLGCTWQLVGVGLDSCGDFGVGTRSEIGWYWSRWGNVLDIGKLLGLVGAHGFDVLSRGHRARLCVSSCVGENQSISLLSQNNSFYLRNSLVSLTYLKSLSVDLVSVDGTIAGISLVDTSALYI